VGVVTLAAVALAVLTVLAPLSQGAPVHPLKTFAPPFNGKAGVATNTQTFGCGVKGMIPIHPKFTKSTGVGIESLKTKAKSCPSGIGYNWVNVEASVGYFSKPITGLSGVHSVVVHWTVAWASSISANRGPASRGSAHATSYIVATLYLLDETNLTYLPPANGWGWYSATYNGTSALTSSANIAMYLNQTLAAGHTFVITCAISASSGAWASSQGPSTALGTLSLTSGTKLTSITLS
jgi:hypothetical protein